MSFNPWLVSEQDPISQNRATKYVYMGLSITIGLVTFLVYVFIWYLCTRRRRRNHNRNSLPTTSSPNGLSKAALAALPITSYSDSDSDSDSDSGAAADSTTDCAVCISQFQKGDRVRRLPKCNHTFHVECVDMWLYSHSTCPICRCEVGEKEGNNKKPDSSRVAAVLLVGQPVTPVLLLPPV